MAAANSSHRGINRYTAKERSVSFFPSVQKDHRRRWFVTESAR